MVYMKNIEEINPFDYHCFYFLGEVGEVILYEKTSVGHLPISGYELIKSGNNIIVGYTQFHLGHHEHSYLFNNKRKYIQYLDFKMIEDIINLKEYPFEKFYMFVNSIELPSRQEYVDNYNPKATSLDNDINDRCDYNKFGGSPFLFDQPLNGQTISKMINVLSICGVGHLGYFETLDEKLNNSNHQIMNIGSKSYAGILKTIYEWSIVSKEPFNNKSEIAQKASLLWEELDLPEDLKDWIISYQDMRVARYLKGETTISYDVEGDEQMPECLSNYIKSNCKYKTLKKLHENLNIANLISQDILDKEKFLLGDEIYTMCILNGINEENFNINEIFTLQKRKGSHISIEKYKDIL